MRTSIVCDASAARWRRKPSAPPSALKSFGGMKNTFCSGISASPVTLPSLSMRSVSPDTIECPKRKAAPANSAEIVASTFGL